jgi:tRNA-splicing ligase RtcB
MIKLNRVDEVRSRVEGLGVDVTLFATEQIQTDLASVRSLGRLDQLAQAIELLRAAAFLGEDAEIDQAVLTPDFHRGATLPVGIALALKGTVLPAAIGNDIGCGMSFAVLDNVSKDEIVAAWDELGPQLRHAFFQGGRSIIADAQTRHDLVAHGLSTLNPKVLEGVIQQDVNEIAAVVHDPFDDLRPGSPFDEWIAPSGRRGKSRDQLLGTIGGGNHFVEIQHVSQVADGGAAWQWQLQKGAVGVMVHSGSVGLGRAVANVHHERLRSRYPRGLRQPDTDLMPFPTSGPNGDIGQGYLSDMVAAARFAAANRLLLSLMVRRAISEVLGKVVGWRLLHDLPHNLIWKEEDGTILHRKGACPAMAGDGTGMFACGKPVIVPGSMGTSSALLKGTSNAECLASAPHGAGRVLSRNAARARVDTTPLRVITPIDLTRARSDLRKEGDRRLAEEAPRAYKPIEPVIETMHLSNMATEVVRLEPIATIKG